VNNLILGITVRNRDTIAFIIILAIIIVFFVLLYKFMRVPGDIDTLQIASGDRVGVLEVNGVIYDSRPFMEDLKKFLNNSSVKAIVVRINSPGGSVGSSQEMYTALKRAKEELPVVVSMADVAASGGYYLAIAADSIIANPGTTTGSIGVIAQLPQFYRLMDKIGIDQEVIKSGKFKDVGNPSREMTPEERAYLQTMIDNVHQQFVRDVARGRRMQEEEVREVADGRIFTGEQAKELGLVDELGNLRDAINAAAKLAGIEGEPKIVYPEKEKRSVVDYLFNRVTEKLADNIQEYMGLLLLPPLPGEPNLS